MTSGTGKKYMGEINVTPLVDVMLVLLIIFMVTAPMMRHGMDVSLPQTTARAIPSEKERLIITVTRDRKIYIDDFETDPGSFPDQIRHIFKARSLKEAFLRADRTLPYGFVARIMAQIKEAGVTKLGMITEPLQDKR